MVMKITGYTYGKKDKGFDELRFVLKALSDDCTRYVLNMLCVRDGKFICTDGRRMHQATAPAKHKVGLYEVLKNTAKLIVLARKEDDLKFPNTDMIIPKEHDHEAVIYGATAGRIQHNVSKRGGALLDEVYLADAAPKEIEATVRWGDVLSPVMIIHELGFAVVMPKRGDQ